MTSTVVPQTAARMRRIDLRVLLGLALLLAGVLGTLAIVQQAGQRTPVLVMARSVQAGQVIGTDDVRRRQPLAAHPPAARRPGRTGSGRGRRRAYPGAQAAATHPGP
jgi:hypothetical protein